MIYFVLVIYTNNTTSWSPYNNEIIACSVAGRMAVAPNVKEVKVAKSKVEDVHSIKVVADPVEARKKERRRK